MQTLTLLTVAGLVTQAYTLPTLTPRINLFEDVLLFDGLAFTGSENQGVSVTLQSFVFLRQIDFDPLTSVLESALSALGLDVGDKISTAVDRAKLFAAVPLSDDVPLTVNECQVNLDNPEHGIALRNFPLCNPRGLANTFSATLRTSDNRNFNATVFSSSPNGFGIISDIDDTIKISNVLDKLKLAQTTLLEDPEPVPGMPELYASLASSLDNPLFIYVSGSPFQLYPFLHDFLQTSFSRSEGPILLQNLTLTSLSSILDFTNSDGVFEYKNAIIDRINGMYPNKSFLAVGDSTQKDPETYGEAFRKYGGNFIRCIWIHRVDGADNSNQRFATAFASVPSNKIRIYSDADIPALQQIDVAGNQC